MLAMMEIAESAVAASDRSSTNLRSLSSSGNGNKPHAHAGGNGNGAANTPRQYKGDANARAKQISESTGIPVEYLRKVLQRLTRGDW